MSLDGRYRSIEDHFVAGELDTAAAEAAQAAAAGQAGGPAWAAKFRIQQAQIDIYRGGHSQEALALLLPELPAELQDTAIGVKRDSLLAIAYLRTGDVPRAEEAVRVAEAKSPDDRSRSLAHLAGGIVAIQTGTLETAEREFEACLSSARASGDEFQQTQALLNIAVVSLRQDHYEDALERFDEVSTIAARIGARQAMEKAQGGAAKTLYRMGDFPRALAYANAAERMARSLGSTIDEVTWLNDAGFDSYRMGDWKAARFSFERSYQAAKAIQNNEETGDALVALASLSLREGDFQSTLALAREAERVRELGGNKGIAFEPTLLEAEAMARQGDIPSARKKLLGMLGQKNGSSPRPFERWQIESALARVFEEAGDRRGAAAWFQRAVATFHLQRDSFSQIDSKLDFNENATSLYDDYMEELLREGRSKDALLLLDRSRAETLSDSPSNAPAQAASAGASWMRDPSSIARRLHGTILVYCVRPRTSYLWAIAPSGSMFFRLPGREVLAPLVESHTRAVVAGKDVLSQENAPGAELFHALIEPARALIPAGGKVFVMADEELSHLNFETLPAPGERTHFWIEDADVVNTKSLSLLAARSAALAAGGTSGGSRKLLLVGDPVYDRPEYVRLPNAKQEVAEVAGHFAADQRSVLTGSDATRSAYLASRPGAFRYIHFVAHATASEAVPLDSAVILSAQPGEPDKYKLYARDIMNSRIQADLVTISACYGSGVRSYSGEGLVGLAWAFLRAGSHNVVGALWEVSDASTPQLMDDLYGGLAKGQSPDVALRSAKLAMLGRGDVFRKPFYWAAFQLYSGS